MEEAVAIITITDEGVSAIITITTILHRFAFGQLAVNQILPTVDGIVNTLFRTDRILISEILDERLNHLLMITTREFWRIVHIDRLPAVAHQGSHRILLGSSTLDISVRIIIIEHIGPIKGNGR